MRVCRGACAHPPGACPVLCACARCVSGVSTPWGSGGRAYIAQSRLHARAHVQPCALSEGLSVCSMCTRVCVYAVGDKIMCTWELGACILCACLQVCVICVGRVRGARCVHRQACALTCVWGRWVCVPALSIPLWARRGVSGELQALSPDLHPQELGGSPQHAASWGLRTAHRLGLPRSPPEGCCVCPDRGRRGQTATWPGPPKQAPKALGPCPCQDEATPSPLSLEGLSAAGLPCVPACSRVNLRHQGTIRNISRCQTRA